MLGQTPTFEEQATRLLPSPTEAEKPRGIRGWFRRFWEWLGFEEDTALKEHRSNVVIDAVKSTVEGIYNKITISPEEIDKLEREHATAARRYAAKEKQRAAEIGIQADGKPIYLSDLSLKEETSDTAAAGTAQKKQSRPEDFSLRTWPLGFSQAPQDHDKPSVETTKQKETPAVEPQEPGDGDDGSTVASEPVIVVVAPADANTAETVAAVPPEAPQTQGEQNEMPPGPANENPAPVVVEKKKGKGFFKGAFLSAAALGAARYGVREGMTQLGWLGGPTGVFATAAGSSVVVTGFAIGTDYRAAKKKILEEMKMNNAESVWNNQCRREVLRTIFNKEGRRKYGVTAAKSFVGGLLGGSAVTGLADFVESPDDATSYLKKKISFLKDQFDSVRGTIAAECGTLRSKCESLLGIAPSTASPPAEPTLKERLVGRDPTPPSVPAVAAATINSPPVTASVAAPTAPPLPVGGDDAPLPVAAAITGGKEPLIMPVLENFEGFAGEGGLKPSTVEKIAEAQHGDPKAIWQLADNFANGTGGVEQDNGMAKIFCAEADRLLDKDSVCPEGDLAKDHDALFEEQMKKEDEEMAAIDARLAEWDGKIEEVRKENDGHFAALKSYLDKMDGYVAEQKAILDEVLGPEEVSTLQDAETVEEISDPGEECAVTDNGDGTYEAVCRSKGLSVGDEFVAHIK